MFSTLKSLRALSDATRLRIVALLEKDELPASDTLHAHHVDPYSEGGESDEWNVWILCTACHRLVEYQRRYRGQAIKELRQQLPTV